MQFLSTEKNRLSNKNNDARPKYFIPVYFLDTVCIEIEAIGLDIPSEILNIIIKRKGLIFKLSTIAEGPR